MKIAFDVTGTLDGIHSVKVVAFFNALQAHGHECYIWSFGGRLQARDCADDHQLKPTACMLKQSKAGVYDEPCEPEFDFCVDDDSQTAEYLDAKSVIYVKDIPDDKDTAKFDQFLKDFNFHTEGKAV